MMLSVKYVREFLKQLEGHLPDAEDAPLVIDTLANPNESMYLHRVPGGFHWMISNHHPNKSTTD